MEGLLLVRLNNISQYALLANFGHPDSNRRVCRRWRLSSIQVPCLALARHVCSDVLKAHLYITSLCYREKGDASKARDFLPADKQYLVTRGVHSLRRATSLAYTDADEDAERLLSFNEGPGAATEGDEWVETHAGRKPHNKAGGDGEIAEIPDIDGHGDDDHSDLVSGVRGMSIGGQAEGKEPEIIDIDEIPDMEEDDLEAGDEATAAPKVPPATLLPNSTTAAPRFVIFFSFFGITVFK